MNRTKRGRPRKKAPRTEKPKVRKKPGPKPGEIPAKALKSIEVLAELFCTAAEMAIYFKRSLRTIQRWQALPIVQEAMERGRNKGFISLRRAQYQTALKGDRTLLIWMGKQYLGQRDKTEVEHTGGYSVVVERLHAARARLAALGRPNGAATEDSLKPQ